jgi:hypothetical protein
MRAEKIKNIFVILLGALPFIWPALWNGYPLAYSDTNVFISQPAPGYFNWDKPFIYGPWMLLVHGWQSLWGVAVAQAILVSQLLWLTLSVFGPPSKTRFLLLCLVLAVCTGASWFVSLLMPDVFSALVVLSIFVLGFSPRLSRSLTVWICLVGALAIAVHLSHLVIAAACVVIVLLLRFSRIGIVMLPLVLALGLLVSTSYYAFNKLAVSPFGSVFMLARLAADGHVNAALDANCPKAGWHLCKWKDRLPSDSDAFMWDGQGPVWSHPGGPIGLAPEASTLVMLAARENPLGVLASMINNTGQQLVMIKLGDTLNADWLDVTVAKSIETHFSADELARFKASKQWSNALQSRVQWLNHLATAALGLSCLLGLYCLWRAVLLRDTRALALLLLVCAGVLANAFATGALSKPHYRYQTRIAWLLVIPPLVLLRRKETHTVS